MSATPEEKRLRVNQRHRENYRSQSTPESGVCVECGESWSRMSRGGRKRIYCSRRCGSKADRKKLKQRKPDYDRRANLRYLYGLTLEEYEALAVTGCRVCGDYKRLVVDHSHVTGKVRGVLCTRCNTALGMLGDNAYRVSALLMYIGGRE